MTIRFDEHGPLDAYEQELHPATLEALERGVGYGALWQNHYRKDWTLLENVQHTVEVHAQCRIAEALERLDNGDLEGFVAKLGSAVGYLANSICKVRYAQSNEG